MAGLIDIVNIDTSFFVTGMFYNELINERIDKENVKEIILALSSTVEGDATAIFIKDHVENIKVSRISYGIPIGGELEYVDSNTIARSIIGRVEINDD